MAENTLAGVLFFGGGIVITALIIALMNRKSVVFRISFRSLPIQSPVLFPFSLFLPKRINFPFYPFRGFISDSP